MVGVSAFDRGAANGQHLWFDISGGGECGGYWSGDARLGSVLGAIAIGVGISRAGALAIFGQAVAVQVNFAILQAIIVGVAIARVCSLGILLSVS